MTAKQAFVAYGMALMVLLMTAFAPRLVVDGDHFWHLVAGQWMLDHRTVLNTDIFSYTFAGKPWNAHEWLAEVAMASVYRLGGWSGLYVFFGGLVALTVYVMARQVLKHLDAIPALIALLFAIMIFKEWVTLRPHVLAMPILAVWTAELLNARKRGDAPRLFLLPLMLLWANLHGSFLFGIALLLPFAFEAVISAKPEDRLRALKSWSAIFLGSIAAAALNPQGISGLLFPLTFGADGATALIPEWQSTNFGRIRALELWLVALFFGGLTVGVRIPWVRLIVLVGMVHLSLTHQRAAVLLAIVGTMLIAEPFGEALRARRWAARTSEPPLHAARLVTITAAVAALGLTGLAYARPLQDVDLSPVSALAHVSPELRTQPVFNDWILSGYLIFSGVRVFVDSRAELYGREFLLKYRLADAGDAASLKEILSEHKIAWTFLSSDSPANAILDELPGWCPVYSDRYASIYRVCP